MKVASQTALGVPIGMIGGSHITTRMDSQLPFRLWGTSSHSPSNGQPALSYLSTAAGRATNQRSVLANRETHSEEGETNSSDGVVVGRMAPPLSNNTQQSWSAGNRSPKANEKSRRKSPELCRGSAFFFTKQPMETVDFVAGGPWRSWHGSQVNLGKWLRG